MTGGGREGGRQIKSNAEIRRDSSSKCFCPSLWHFLEREKNFFICASIWDKCISDKQPPQIGIRRPEPQRRCVFTTETITEDLITKQENSTTSLPLMQHCQLSFNLINKAGICFSLVLYNTLPGHLKKGCLSGWKNRHAFDMKCFWYPLQTEVGTQLCCECSNQTLSCLKTTNICFLALTHILQSVAKFLLKQFDGQNGRSSVSFRWFWNNDRTRRKTGGLGENVDSKYRYKEAAGLWRTSLVALAFWSGSL